MAHAPQIQLELTAGLPFTLLAFHRLADRPSIPRGAALGAVMAVQALCCGYYGIFAIWSRRAVRDHRIPTVAQAFRPAYRRAGSPDGLRYVRRA